jgi:hypothetical protein
MKIGTFLCKVIAPSNGWFGEAGANNTPFIRIPLETSEGERITYQGWITDKSAEHTIQNLCKVFGWDGDLEALAGETDDGPFVGMECEIVTEEETYNGKSRVVIKWLNAPGSSGKTMEREKALALARKLTGKSKAAPPPARKPPVDPDLDAPGDDSIPF